MMLNSEEEEVLQRPTHSQPEILCPSVNDVPVRKAARKVADEYLNLSQKIGSKEQLDKYVEDYEIFNGKGESADKLMADDILRTLMNEKKMTKMEAGVVFKIGSGRWNRIKKNVPTDGSVERRLPYGRNGSQMEEREMQVLSNFIDSLEITVAYPCNHRKMKRYLPDVDSWKSLWDSYKVFAEQEPRMMQYSTFHKYVRSRHSEYALGKSREDDDCETCTRLKVTAQDSRLTVDERELAKTGLKEHSLEERGMTSLLKEGIKLYGKDLLQDKDVAVLNGFNLGVDFLSDYFDDIPLDQPNLAVDKTDEVIVMQCEGFSNSFSMPFYSNRKQGIDDHSNLVSLHSYIISDMLTGFNRMYTYDERTMGRNLDSICSIRFLHHMRLYLEKRSAPGKRTQPEILYFIMDDSVGPEKSQEGLMFFALLSLLFYKKIICHYLPKSHSHMCADKVISSIRKRIGATINEFHPTGLIQKINEAFTAKTEYFGHEDVNSPLYEDWNLLLNNHFSSIPVNSENNYSKNNFFEFTNGSVTIRKNINTEHSFVHQFIKSESLSDVRMRLMTSLFGHTNLARAELSDIQLTKHTVKRLSEEKVAALRLKISTIPVENLSYYELEEKDTFVMADRTRPSLSGMKRGRPTLKSSDSHSSSSIPFARYTP